MDDAGIAYFGRWVGRCFRVIRYTVVAMRTRSTAMQIHGQLGPAAFRTGRTSEIGVATAHAPLPASTGLRGLRTSARATTGFAMVFIVQMAACA